MTRVRAVMFDRESPVPLHHQIALILRGEIDSGTYPPGSRLLTELELCERFGISRTPARRALTTLAEEGVIIRFRRRGSFVAEGHVPGREIEILHVPGNGGDDQWRRLVGSIFGAEPPDGAVVPVGWVAELAAMGAIAEVSADPDPAEALWVPEALRAMWEIDGGAYAIPVHVELHGLWLRSDALGAIGGRPPSTWSDLRTLVVSARDLMTGVTSPFVMPAGSAAGTAAVMATWLLLAAAGAAGPVDLDSAGAEVFRFVRRLIDTGLMSPDVVRLDARGVVDVLRRGEAVAGLGPSGALAGEPGWVFAGVPGPRSRGSEMTTLADGLAGVVMRRSDRRPTVEARLASLARPGHRTVEPSLLAMAHVPAVTAQSRLLAAATMRLVEGVVSGRDTVEHAVRNFHAVASLVTA